MRFTIADYIAIEGESIKFKLLEERARMVEDEDYEMVIFKDYVELEG